MEENSIPSGTSDSGLFAGEAWFDPIDVGVRDRVRGFIQEIFEQELTTPEFLITDGGFGLDRALAALWPNVPDQRCTVHKHRNLLAHASDALHEEVTANYNDMILCGRVRRPERRLRWRRRLAGLAGHVGRTRRTRRTKPARRRIGATPRVFALAIRRREMSAAWRSLASVYR